jgi:Icc-related predicted phosphoesterase
VKFPRRRKRERFRCFFATDIHGSDRCFRKFLAAADVYGAQALILGGDIAGKAIVPVVDEGNGRYRMRFQGAERVIGVEELEETRAVINYNGLYPKVCDETEVARLNEDPTYLSRVFQAVIGEQVDRWCRLAAERLHPDVRLVITPGNDDPAVIDEVLERAQRVEFTELRVAEVGPVWLASLGNTNRTPWKTEREFAEEELASQIDEMVEPYADGRPLVFNFHCPPYDSGLDNVAQLDDELRPVTRHGAIVEIPAGSHAVREAITKYAPVVGLHGHIHEALGARRLGSTMCLNPGSDYSSGVLKGVIVDLALDGGYIEHVFTTG